MDINEAVALLSQMYLFGFDDKEKEALTMAIHSLQDENKKIEPQYVKDIHFVNISMDDGFYYGTCPFCGKEIQWYGDNLDTDRKYTKCIYCDKPVLWRREEQHYYF